MRLWSLNSYKCMEEYSLPDAASLVDFDFDESKVKPPQVHSCVKLTGYGCFKLHSTKTVHQLKS